MATENRQISVGELDFDQIKNNIKTYLRSQSEFSDYDFEGSGLSVLLDVLSLNTHYNALYNNLTINELFLDSATKRSSVVSRASELGYVPHSATCSQAIINLTVSNTTTPTPPVSINIPKNTPFSTLVNNVNYTFYTTENLSAINNGSGVYTFENVTIKQGVILTYKYVVSSGIRYIIPNTNADISTLSIRVQDSSSSSNYITYSRSDTIINVKSTDKVYFVKEIENGLYELTFGDGIIGSSLSNGNIVHIEYFVCDQDAPNGARIFTYNGDSLSGGTVGITVVSPAFNGSAPESIESIRYNAPKSYVTQNRAVTTEDYKTLIYNYFPQARSVSVWGGENNDPPVYGKTFICVKSTDSETLTAAQKQFITNNIIKPRSVVSITPEFVDANYINIALNVTVYYNERETTRSINDIATLVEQTILNYNDSELQKFDGIFRFSKLSRLIDTSEPSIVNNIMTLTMRREIEPRYNTSAQYKINLINPIYTEGVPEQAVSSTGFYISGSDEIHYLQDDGIGNIQLYHNVTSGAVTTIKIVDPAIGAVDYTKGVIVVTNLNITSIVGDKLELIMKPYSSDVVSAYTQIAQIDTSNLNVSVISDKTANGDLGAGNNYIFTSSEK